MESTIEHGSSEEDKPEVDLSPQQQPRREQPRKKNYSESWTYLVGLINVPILWCLQFLTSTSARYPNRTIVLVGVTSVALLGIGFATDFNLQVDEAVLWTPQNSQSMQHSHWTASRGYEGSGRYLKLFFHATGKDVLGQAQVQRMFDAYDTIRTIDGYNESCSLSWYRDLTGTPTCEIEGPIRFWNSSTTTFQNSVSTDEEAIVQMSPLHYPDGFPVVEDQIFGQFNRSETLLLPSGDNETVGVLSSAKSYFVYIYLSYSNSAAAIEEAAIDAILALDDQWRQQDGDNPVLFVEIETGSSFGDEFLRGIYSDLILVPFVGLVMVGFTCLVFYKRDRVQSRVMLGCMAVVSAGLSIMFSYGIMFIRGVPFTPVSQCLPFILFGIGLDDTFVIMGEYDRTSPKLSPEERIRLTIEEVGISITLTTLTSTIAFALGTTSSIPAVIWLCQYAFPATMVVYFWTLTFFVACMVRDERRIQDGRFDICSWKRAHPKEDDDAETKPGGGGSTLQGGGESILDSGDDDNHSQPRDGGGGGSTLQGGGESILDSGDDDNHSQPRDGGGVESHNNATKGAETDKMKPGSAVDRYMEAYARWLVQPKIKIAVAVGFTGLSIALCVSASKIEQEFSFQAVLPSDSYLTDFLNARADYANLNQMQPGLYFRDVNQSDPAIRQEMKNFIDDMRAMDGVSGGPDFCWLYEFEKFVEDVEFVKDLEFRDQLGFFLGVPLNAQLFYPDIRLDYDGNIKSSRCLINFYNIDMEDVTAQIDALSNLKRIAAEQPINEGISGVEHYFFSSERTYNAWEFYAAAVNELISSAILAIVSVTAVAFLLMPHWSAAVIVFPLMCILYVDLIGLLNWGGVSINAISYVILVIAIGLMVDFIMHVLLRYYEIRGNRREKTIEMMRTMGSSVLLGGLSTLLATLPLLFSTSDIFHSVAIGFIGLITLGVGNGLIVLPVILATIGTEEVVSARARHASEISPHSAGATEDEFSSSGDEGNSARVKAIVKEQQKQDSSDKVEEDSLYSYLVKSVAASSAGSRTRDSRRAPDPPSGSVVVVPALALNSFHSIQALAVNSFHSIQAPGKNYNDENVADELEECSECIENSVVAEEPEECVKSVIDAREGQASGLEQVASETSGQHCDAERTADAPEGSSEEAATANSDRTALVVADGVVEEPEKCVESVTHAGEGRASCSEQAASDTSGQNCDEERTTDAPEGSTEEAATANSDGTELQATAQKCTVVVANGVVEEPEDCVESITDAGEGQASGSEQAASESSGQHCDAERTTHAPKESSEEDATANSDGTDSELQVSPRSTTLKRVVVVADEEGNIPGNGNFYGRVII